MQHCPQRGFSGGSPPRAAQSRRSRKSRSVPTDEQLYRKCAFVSDNVVRSNLKMHMLLYISDLWNQIAKAVLAVVFAITGVTIQISGF
jgi:hypothetical protein